jgi:2-iminoacetate synthase ThiH
MDDRAILEATGRHPDEWFAFLDAQGATSWTGDELAAWLDAEGIDPQWREAIAERYHAARGMS